MAFPNPSQIVSPLPQPPEYAKQYTDENIERKCVLPPPPVPTEFTVFGEEYNLDEEMIRSLQAQKMQQLYSSAGDWRSELKKLNRSTVAAFLDLLDILIRCPDHPERLEKLNNLRLLFINMHHLINEYRPLQARDTLQLMLKQQISSIESVIERFRLHLKAGREALKQCIDEIPTVPDIPPTLVANEEDDSMMTMFNTSEEESTDGVPKEARMSPAERRERNKRDIALCALADLLEHTDIS
ncbi:hypothetical protein AB6A40_001087 [Gnathostoma spinigerum]|uniref:Mediator of RNA polymerase II transcription subunit 7 n=1 Tax=Gnathostoma spinigerum TaxID=75299 RepID=A0ABD6E3D8_9BILA